ncbi:pyruvate dehydrogenase (acetyl-transferring) E1 component subunit alpha [Flavihumibacter rivuli]|uniref:pyruvate dehydrogenase (acetyl-transferring) E1 component subunit alpha n=1 Tax=Flavihumibacter rivuli TaxID=2838156 RepID=UPI001BDEF1E7|nr:pyruvate dehydrogenase (acetyl-transferring) E1 component subunit alpha [Flavihumibacter rivuli]ULQ57607.1 pyruvate dehydrogenase (acetyl-transferring) E1 component subunit alpha [Flavihumibacter rivuli]
MDTTLKAGTAGQDNVDHYTNILYQMQLIRRFEERSAELYTQSLIRGFLHLYVGEEAVAVGVMQALTGEDSILSTYREHGHALARGVDAGRIMAEMYGKQEGCSRGRGGSMHLFDASKKFYGGNAIVGGHLPMAVGMALAAKKQGKASVTCCFFGEGAAAEGEFHEAMNLAALWSVPLLLVCENNLYAMGTAIRFSHSETHLEKKGEGYGMATMVVDGMDVLKVEAAAKQAVDTIRQTGKPLLLVANTYRFRAHSMFDAELYREKTEVEEWKQKDPIPALYRYMKEQFGFSEAAFQGIESKVEEEIKAAIDFAEKGKWEPVEELTRFVHSETQTN